MCAGDPAMNGRANFTAFRDAVVEFPESGRTERRSMQVHRSQVIAN